MYRIISVNMRTKEWEFVSPEIASCEKAWDMANNWTTISPRHMVYMAKKVSS